MQFRDALPQATLVILDDDSLDQGDDAGRGFAPARSAWMNWYWWSRDDDRGERRPL